MEFIIFLTAALLPAILLLLYIWKKDTKKEPTSWLAKAFLWGIACTIPAGILEIGICYILFGEGGEPSSILGNIVNAFIAVAIPEEGFKLLALWLVLRKNPYFDEHFDGIVYAVFVGLGFAAFENIGYVFAHGIPVAISRALFSVPGHYANAILMGYFYSMYHFVNRSPKVKACILLAPVLTHGIFDACIFSITIDLTTAAVAAIIFIVFFVKLQKFASKKVTALVERDKQDIYRA